ncbi:helix-turn-helix domain-containing protein [Peribacillus sp. FSL K6-1552]|uniref:helix-turn-helix domain-containing protein n=1 Tax=Peribacillus sp. FSL K6-1552 TaxID=2954514 RepID=UPI004046A697
MEDEYELTTFEREQLEVLHKLGHSTKEMSAVLNRHHSCIATELKRNHNINEKYHSRRL